jgi:hypothetical protein
LIFFFLHVLHIFFQNFLLKTDTHPHLVNERLAL